MRKYAEKEMNLFFLLIKLYPLPVQWRKLHSARHQGLFLSQVKFKIPSNYKSIPLNPHTKKVTIYAVFTALHHLNFSLTVMVMVPEKPHERTSNSVYKHKLKLPQPKRLEEGVSSRYHLSNVFNLQSSYRWVVPFPAKAGNSRFAFPKSKWAWNSTWVKRRMRRKATSANCSK